MPSYHLPIYPREPSGTYYLHTSLLGKAFKRSLHTKDRHEATLLAIPIIKAIEALRRSSRGLPAMTIKKFEIDLKNQIFKSNGTPEDNSALLEALARLPAPALTHTPTTAQTALVEPQEGTRPDISLLDLLEDYKLFKKLGPASIVKYEGIAKEFSVFCRNKTLNNIRESDFLRWQKSLFEKKQALWTVQVKTNIVNSLFEFAIKRKNYNYSNPVTHSKIMTRKDKLNSAYDPFDLQEILKIYNTEDLANYKKKDPDFYFVILIGLLTGMRVNEITTLKKQNLFSYKNRLIVRITDSKTKAGERKISLPPEFSVELKKWIDSRSEEKLFKYLEREGKGSGNAVGKKFSRILQAKGLTYRKYVFHSIRKFLNNYLRQHSVSLEMRSQIIGHSVFKYDGIDLSNNTNIDYYSKDYELEAIIEKLEPQQNTILMNIQLS